MSTWPSDELDRIARAEELEIASVRRDGTLRKPVTIWVVREGDDLYVRSVNGRAGAWFWGAQDRHKAQIRAGGVRKDVRLVETDHMADEIDIRTPVPPWPSPPVVLPKPRLRPPPPSRPSSPSPGLPGLIAAILAALVGGVVAFRDALIPFLQHLFGG